MRVHWAFIVLTCLLGSRPVNVWAQGQQEAALPFNREVINRFSLDHLPRSVSIRQGQRTWLGYDLERAKLYKVWQSPDDQPGLRPANPSIGLFVVRSQGTDWYEDKTETTWQLQREGENVPLMIRYLGCSQRQEYFELQWELKSDSDKRTLYERIPMKPEPGTSVRAVRDIRVEPLADGEKLLFPRPARAAWKRIDTEVREATALTTPNWYRIFLP